MNIFVNNVESRPRSGWRLCFQFILFLLFSFILFAIKEDLFSQTLNVLHSFIFTIAAISSILLSAKFIDRRPIKDYGLAVRSTWWYQFLVGLGIGTVTLVFIFVIEWISGWITITGFGWERTSQMPYGVWFLSFLCAMILVGFYEEFLFRGYQIINLIDGFQNSGRSSRLSAVGAIAISSLIFGLLYTSNPDTSGISLVNSLLAGIVLAVPFLLTGQLALSIGLHISWKFVQGGILGFPVRGKPFRGSLIQIETNGSDLFTGGSFGPEAGLLGTACSLIMLGLICLYIQKSEYSLTLHPFFENPYIKSRKNA